MWSATVAEKKFFKPKSTTRPDIDSGCLFGETNHEHASNDSKIPGVGNRTDRGRHVIRLPQKLPNASPTPTAPMTLVSVDVTSQTGEFVHRICSGKG